MSDFIKTRAYKKDFRLSVQGNSMLPIIQSGDIVEYRKTPYERLKTDDVVLAGKKGVYFTHRIIFKSKTFLITKGDNNTYSDGRIRPSSVLGKAVNIIRDGKAVALDSKYNMQSLMYAIALRALAEELNKKHVCYLVLKGLPVYLHLDKHNPRRLYSDCDILVGEEDREKLHGILRRQGFTPTDTGLPFDRAVEKKSLPETSFVKIVEGIPVVLDIHYRIALTIVHLGSLNALYPQSEVDRLSKLFLREKVMVKTGGVPYPILSQKNMTLYLALHLFQHNFRGAQRLQMLDSVIRKTGDKNNCFASLRRTIADFRIQPFVYPVFVLLKKHYNSPIPGKFLKSIEPAPIVRVYIRKNITGINVFDEEKRIRSGMRRFANLLFLSPEKPWRKLLVFGHPAVLYAIVWTLFQKVKFAVLAAALPAPDTASPLTKKRGFIVSARNTLS